VIWTVTNFKNIFKKQFSINSHLHLRRWQCCRMDIRMHFILQWTILHRTSFRQGLRIFINKKCYFLNAIFPSFLWLNCLLYLTLVFGHCYFSLQTKSLEAQFEIQYCLTKISIIYPFSKLIYLSHTLQTLISIHNKYSFKFFHFK